MSNEDGSGPAFPVTAEQSASGAFPDGGLSQRAYAAIHLRVTDTALPEWLNAMIERARRLDRAGSAGF